MGKWLQASVVFTTVLFNISTMAPAQTLSLDDCIRLALQKSQRLVSAGYAVQAAEFRRQETGTLKKPTVNLRSGASFAPVTGLDPVLTEGGEYAGLLEIQQPLYNGAIKPARQQAEVNLQQATVAQTRTAADIRLEVRQAYAELLHAQRQLTLTQASLNDLQSYLETVRSLAHGGAVPKLDIMKVEIQLQSETITLTDLRTVAAVAMQRLLEPVGLPLDTMIAIQDSIALPGVSAPLRANPDLKEFELGIESARLEVKLAQAERLPVLSAFGSAGGWTSRNQLLESNPRHIFGYQAGIELEMPLWNWGVTTARIEQKNAALKALNADFEVLQRRLRTDFQTLQQQLRATQEKLVLLQQSRTKAGEQYNLLLAQYAGGGASSLEVLEAHRTWLEIVLQEEQTRADRNSIQAQLLRLTGETE